MTGMLSNVVQAGSRIEMQAAERQRVRRGVAYAKVYHSRVYEVLSEDTMEIVMPMEKTKIVLLPVDAEFDVMIYTNSGPYQCSLRITDRYKSNNVYLLVVELTRNLRKYQRREYYRLSCSLEISTRVLQEEEQQAVENNLPYTLTPGIPLEQGTIVDISGGGVRFLSKHCYEPEDLLYLNYRLPVGEEGKLYELLGKVLSVKELENRSDIFEHRIQYYGITRNMREEIIRYIFEEERKSRRKERWR